MTTEVTDGWRLDAAAHARSCFPREACGLVVVHRGRLAYVACDNVAATPEEHFRITADDHARAEALGEVVGVFHSHPNASEQPSGADASACRASGVRWYILALPSGCWAEIDPTLDPALGVELYGREFVHGVSDCYTFVRAWYAAERGVTLREFARDDEWWKHGGNLYLDGFGLAGFVQAPGPAQTGDVLLMQIHADVPNHAAIYLGEDQIGHHLYGRLSSRDVYGGYYRKHTTHILRYAGHDA